jgi:methionine-gamma-lyase
MIAELASDCFRESGKNVTTSIDNTFLGPVFQKPARQNIDYIIYSATKYLGGHSDIIAGAVSCNTDLSKSLRKRRTYLGNMGNPHDAWLLSRSLETLHVRMKEQQSTAHVLAQFLSGHEKISRVSFLGLDNLSARDKSIFDAQCLGAGAMLAFTLKSETEKSAYAFLNALKIVKLAVSLGSTESLAQHPFTMTHANVPQEEKLRLNISEGMIRISVGLEDPEDLIADLEQALAKI